MTQEDKDLIIQDLSCRLPYGVKCHVIEEGYKFTGTLSRIEFDEQNNYVLDFNNQINLVDYPVYSFIVKPYLFPLTEEILDKATEESINLYKEFICIDSDLYIENNKSLLLQAKIRSSVIKYFHIHHIDYNGLIEKGLAIDATNLNIY